MGDNATPTAPPREAFDYPAALAQLGGEEAFFAQVAALFLADSPRLLEAARQALARGDPAGVRKAAHTLKGSVSYLCAGGATAAARRLEATASAEALAALEQEVDRLHAALTRSLSG
jgi:two-component system, sensor histidine kinase and response regulator